MIFTFLVKMFVRDPSKSKKSYRLAFFSQPTWIFALLGLIESFFQAFFSF